MIEDILKRELSNAQNELARSEMQLKKDPDSLLYKAGVKNMQTNVSMLKDLVEYPPILFVDRLDDQWPRDTDGCLLKVGDTVTADGHTIIINSIERLNDRDSRYIIRRKGLLWFLNECKLKKEGQ